MITPSTKEIMNINASKYAVVVAVAKRARDLSEEKKSDENYRLSSMVTEALEEVLSSRIIIQDK
ncbi:RNA polymerase, subunit omega/K/RPB6 [Syntrophomonas zehnderi OL-4]|uniref:DNA-directed RNA polymerase subunit omega n=1 Tax=Syntrophomonas zehnderi OL-4 TaxID=690567 RepID=A0A0E4C8Y3_9FIRM|nr:DNA-directed RNA polymerase subunit omega [Syntrophomonas zehnderi]CFX76992.1 RNA polymerase, subunit omega/K/RPB6 [Syntrophomonas zehnderi OL-4]